MTLHNEIQAQVKFLSFVATNDDLQSFSIPAGYSVSNNGIEKVAGESMITVCRRPVIIKSKTFSVDEKIFKLILAYMTQTGNWETLPPTKATIVFHRNKLVDLANNGLPVTSSNSNLLVDYRDAFNAQNENCLPLTYTVSRCGWFHFNGKDYFVDPRRDCFIVNKEKNISVVVDSLSQFAKSLLQGGKLSEWKKAYELAKKFPVARIMVVAAIAPILLKILGERKFLLYIVAPTRAGKTTALYLAASAVGDEKMIRSFDATKNSLASAAADVNDFAFLIDEKQVADHRLKEQFDTLAYALALSAADCKAIRNTIKKNHGLAFPLVIDKIFEVGFEKLCETYQNIVDLFTKNYPDLLNDYCRYIAILTLADAILNAALTDTEGFHIDEAIQNTEIIFKLIPTIAEIPDTA